MKNKRRLEKMLLAFVALVLASALGGCQTPTPEVTEKVVTQMPPSWCNPLVLSEDEKLFDPNKYRLSNDGPYLDGLVIVTLPPDLPDEDVIKKITDATPGGMTLIEQVINLDGLEIRLYSYNQDLVLWDVVRAIYQAAMEAEVNVYADPVYVIGWPWDIAGSPWDIIAPSQDNSLPDEGQFRSQWALVKIRLGELSATAEDAHVVVFDTSPSSLSLGLNSFGFTEGPGLELCVSRPVPVIAPAVSEDSDYSDHGVAVAGLIHAVAQQRHIHLVKVLNQHVKGDLYTLLKAMSLYLQEIHDGYPFDSEGDTLQNVVINLSLGLPVDLEMPQDLRDLFALDPDTFLNTHSDWQGEIQPGQIDFLKGGFPDLYLQPFEENVPPVPALAFLVDWATDRGAVIVAAAGNDSAGTESPKPAQLPARYSDVIGVAASNQDDQLSCFSNSGDVAAPGGEGRQVRNGNCEPMVDQCNDELCPYGLISLVSQSTSETGYTWMAGTSFAAPLVSGQVALLLEQGVSVEDISHAIRCTDNFVTQGAVEIPIINVPSSLEPDCLQ